MPPAGSIPVCIAKMSEEEKCSICLTQEDGEHVTIPIRDLSFLTINLDIAFTLLAKQGHTFSREEKIIMKGLTETYRPIIHYWSSGRYWDNEMAVPKNKHESYM